MIICDADANDVTDVTVLNHSNLFRPQRMKSERRYWTIMLDWILLSTYVNLEGKKLQYQIIPRKESIVYERREIKCGHQNLRKQPDA